MDEIANPEEPIKLVMMGLQNAGKTSIVDLIAQEQEKPLTSIPNMNPTKGVQRITLFDEKVVIWDFGGQGIYRNEYLTHPERYFHMISYFYYVIDVQDYYRIISSFMYFMGVYNLIEIYSPDAHLVFLFHKTDPDFDPTFKNLKQKFLDKIQKFLEIRGREYEMYDTTIFDLASVKNAFKKVFPLNMISESH